MTLPPVPRYTAAMSIRQIETGRTLALLAAVAVGGAALGVGTDAARGLVVQEQVGAKIGVVDPTAVFAQMKEKQAADAKLQQQQQTFDAERQTQQQAVQQLQSALQEQRPGTDAYTASEDELINKLAEFQAFVNRETFKLESETRRTITQLYRKIQAATADVAEQKGVDLVLASDKALPANLGQLPVKDVSDALRDRNILYRSEQADLTQEVLLKLDAEYAGGQ